MRLFGALVDGDVLEQTVLLITTGKDGRYTI